MENIIKKISNTLTLVVVFFVSALFYFGYKGFVYENGKIFLKPQVAQAAETNGIASVLPQNISLGISYKFAEGSPTAPLTLYEFSSLGCPHCADFHLNVMPKLKSEFINNGFMRVVFVHFPLDKQSMKAAMLAECMTYENRAAFLNEMFYNQRSWWLDNDDQHLLQYAAEFGLAYDEASACLKNDAIARDIVSIRQEAITRLKMQGTPAFLISGRDGNEIIYGYRSFKDISDYIYGRLQRLNY